MSYTKVEILLQSQQKVVLNQIDHPVKMKDNGPFQYSDNRICVALGNAKCVRNDLSQYPNILERFLSIVAS